MPHVRNATIAPPPKRQVAQPQMLPKQEPPWHVILLDDNNHTFRYVVEMLEDIFGHSVELGFKMAEEVHESGRVIVATVHKELAELRQQQIHEYQPRLPYPDCKGHMQSVIECSE
ncbi:MAG: ATP-dependent Clp protease adaptor ClpS [Verrucomicrobiaceae bacterium]|nr:ATP-dependent Clp protease adaptor ClpS [Verrucomicrobiaceae bacterium]